MRKKYSFLLILGLLVFITPFLGVPESWKSILLFSLGVCIILCALTYRFTNRKEEYEQGDTYFAESDPATHPVGQE